MDVLHDHALVDVIEEVVKIPLVELQRFVDGADPVVKVLAAGRLRILVEGAVQDQDWQSNRRKFLLESLVSPNRCGHSSCRLSLVVNQRILVHGFHDLRVARKPLIRKVKDVGMRRKVAQPF